MDEHTHDIIYRLMEQATDNSVCAERFSILVNMLIYGAELDYSGKALRVGNDEAVMEFIKAVYYSTYKNKLESLQKKKEEEKNDGK